ncbi:thermonuclease family protein [Spirillospora sp. NPDC047279]|uniref:thermonuclease family protein n=1 Tax=Spirillospora sp. NPDC047279 TaxID=3155478 RepID=UPI0033F6CBF0
MLAFDFPRVIRPAVARRLIRTSDGDTPVVEQPIRMVSVDTPEKAGYAGLPATAQLKLDRTRTRLTDGTFDGLVPDGLRDHLVSRLTSNAAERHINAGVRASAYFEALQERRLTRPGGARRRTAVVPTGELIDRYGRLLAYVAPWFEGGDQDPLPPRDHPDRRTFNLDMVAAGWGAMFLIYPSLPREPDLRLLVREAESAWNERRGVWAEFGEDVLLAYEYRACVKLGERDLGDPAAAVAGAYQRICVDLRDLRVMGEFGYHEVPPSRRLWIWKDDLDRAREDLKLPV